MLAEVLHFDRSESARTRMQGHFRKTDTLYFQALDKLLAEMQTRGGGRHGALMLGIDRLEALFVLFIRLALDIFGKGRFSQHFQHLPEFIVTAFPQEADRTP